jgi:hypothetical protein
MRRAEDLRGGFPVPSRAAQRARCQRRCEITTAAPYPGGPVCPSCHALSICRWGLPRAVTENLNRIGVRLWTDPIAVTLALRASNKTPSSPLEECPHAPRFSRRGSSWCNQSLTTRITLSIEDRYVTRGVSSYSESLLQCGIPVQRDGDGRYRRFIDRHVHEESAVGRDRVLWLRHPGCE